MSRAPRTCCSIIAIASASSKRQVAETVGSSSHMTHRWMEMDSNFRFRASSDSAGVGVLRSTWAVLTLRRRGPDWNATKRRQDSERRASTAAE